MASLLVALAATPVAFAAPFGDRGIAIPPIHIPGGQARPAANLQQADGKIVIVGTADGPIASTMFAARFSATGVLDPTYGVGGIAYIDIPPDLSFLSSAAAALDAGGNVIIAGQGTAYYPSLLNPNIVVAKLLSSGLPDLAFGVGGLARPTIPNLNQGTNATGVGVDSQGRIVIGGGANDSSGGQGGFLVVRLLPSGDLDLAFNAIGYRILHLSPFNFGATSLGLTAADGVMLAGAIDLGSSLSFAVARVAASGGMDGAFGTAGVAYVDTGRVATVDGGGNVFVAAQINSFPPGVIAVSRLTNAGVPDLAFGVGGTAQIDLTGQLFDSGLTAIRLDSVGRIVLSAEGLAGGGNGGAILVVRLMATGSPDAGFGTAGIQSVPMGNFFYQNVVLGRGLGDTVLLSAGMSDTFIAHLTAAGMPDAAFNGTGSLLAQFGTQPLKLTGMVRQTDGKLVILGYGDFGPNAPASPFVVARLTLAGALDSSFNGKGYRIFSIANGASYFNSIALDASGRIVLANRDYSNNFLVMRLLPGGALDPAFNGTGSVVVADTPTNINQRAHGLTTDSQSNILLAGGSVIRLTSNGALDGTFGSGGLAPMPVLATDQQRLPIIVDSLDRPVIGGTASNGTYPSFAVARLTHAGLPDPSFSNGGVAVLNMGPHFARANVNSIALDGSGRFVLGGPGADEYQNPVAVVARITSAGALDPSFNLTGFNTFLSDYNFPDALALDPSSKIVITGYGLTLRFTGAGVIDPTFNAGHVLTTSILAGSNRLQSTAVVADASGIYLAGTAGNAMAVVRPFDGIPTKLALFAAIAGTGNVAATPFDEIVQAQDAAGNPQPVAVATPVTLTLLPTGTLLGTTTCTIPAGQMYCTAQGVIYPTSGYQQIQAAVMAGDQLAPVISPWQFVSPGNVTIAIVSDTPDPSAFGQPITVTWAITSTVPIAPTGYVNVTVDGGSGCFIMLPLTTCTFTPASAGTKSLVATYQGDATFGQAVSPPVTHVVSASTVPLVLLGVVSRKAHGNAGATFDLPLTGSALLPTIEPRVGPSQTVVFTFNKPISASTAIVTEGNASATFRNNFGYQVFVTLTGVADRQYVTLSLTNVGSLDGTSTNASVRIGYLAGDVNQSRSVSLADVGQVNAQLSQPVTATNYLKDVNASGTLTLSDKVITNNNLTGSLPAP